MAFQPSEYSTSPTGSADLGDLGDLGRGGNVGSRPGGKRPQGGSYIDGEYIYNYNSATNTIHIVLSPRGGSKVIAVSPGASFDAIYAKIQQIGTPADSATVKAMRQAAPGPSAALAQSRAPASYSLAPAAADTGLAVTATADAPPFYKTWWFLGGAGVVALGAAWWLTRPVPVAVRANPAPSTPRWLAWITGKGSADNEVSDEDLDPASYEDGTDTFDPADAAAELNGADP